MANQQAAARERVWILDTTLRDGEAFPSSSMTVLNKLEIAEMLDEVSVDIVEAGFPAASRLEFEIVSVIAGRLKTASVAAFARGIATDIDAAAQAVKRARRPRINIAVPISPLQLAHQRRTQEQALEIIVDSVSRARNLVDDVGWSAVDATRTPIDFLCRYVDAAIEAGATSITLPDTVGMATPNGYRAIFRAVRERVPSADKAVFSTHCHDYLGLAVANSMAGLDGGARQVECTINGLGQRLGNASLCDVVSTLRDHQKGNSYHIGVNGELVPRASDLATSICTSPARFREFMPSHRVGSSSSAPREIRSRAGVDAIGPPPSQITDHQEPRILRSSLPDIRAEAGGSPARFR